MKMPWDDYFTEPQINAFFGGALRCVASALFLAALWWLFGDRITAEFQAASHWLNHHATTSAR